MRIWRQSGDALSTDPLFEPYQKALIEHSQEGARPGTTVDVHGVEVSSKILERSRYIESLNTPQIIDNALQAS